LDFEELGAKLKLKQWIQDLEVRGIDSFHQLSYDFKK